jgi:hypothetical protein
VLVYLLIYPTGVLLMLRIVWRGPATADEESPIAGLHPAAPIKAALSPAAPPATSERPT